MEKLKKELILSSTNINEIHKPQPASEYKITKIEEVEAENTKEPPTTPQG
jgi:hypothetical protein